MVRRDGAEIRKQRIQEVAQAVMRQLTQASPLNLSELLPELQYQTGLTKEKITEYLGIIASTGRFELDLEKGKIVKFPVPQATEDQILNAARGPSQ